MATVSSSHQRASISEHLQCAICLDLIKDSRLLIGCQHTFCLVCLKSLIQQSSDQTRLTCPSCRLETPLPGGGPEDLPSNRLVNQLLETLQPISDIGSSQVCEECDEDHMPVAGYCEQCQLLLCDGCVRAHARSKTRRHHTILLMSIYQERKEANSLPVREPECPVHHGERLDVLCITCQSAICYKCAAVDHQRCEKGDLEAACFNKKSEINKLISKVQRNVLEPLQSAIIKTKKHWQAIDLSAEKAKAAITEHFEICQELLQQRKQQLLSDVDRHHSAWQKCFIQTLKQLTADLHSAVQVTEASKQTIDTNKKSELIAAAGNAIDQLTSLHETQTNLADRPPPSPQPICFVANLQNNQAAINNMGTITGNELTILRAPPMVLKNVSTTFAIKSTPATCRPVVRVQAPENGLPAEVVMYRHEKDYLLKLRTKALGKHKVHVQVSGCEMETLDKSFEVRSTAILDKPRKTISGKGRGDYQFRQPRGITMCDDHVLVADRDNHRLQEFNIDGQLIRSFQGSGELYAATRHPSGVVLASDTISHQLQVFSRSGKALHKIGSKGSQPGQLNCPRGIAVTSSGHVVVADGDNHRVQILDVAGSPPSCIRQFSSCGPDTKLSWPFLLTVDPTNDQIFVANHSGDAVEVFTKEGLHIRSIGKGHGKGPGEMSKPSGVALHPSGNILISDYDNNRVSIFTREGQFVGQWGEMEDPRGVACNDNGHVFISQGRGNCVRFY